MDKIINELWKNLQGLDSKAQKDMLEEFAQDMYNEGKSDGYKEHRDEQDLPKFLIGGMD